MNGFITVELFLWGFITLWVETVAPADGNYDFMLLILSAFIFWSMFDLSQRSFGVSFLEEVWSRNIINLFASPVKVSELILGFALIGVAQVLLAFFYVTPLAFLLYTLKIWDLGLYIIPFFVNILVFGWVLGVVTIGLVVRFGPSADILAFFIPFLLLPFSAVYYPISVFPPLLHVFWASVLNLICVLLGFLFLYWMLRLARTKGYLSRLVQD